MKRSHCTFRCFGALVLWCFGPGYMALRFRMDARSKRQRKVTTVFELNNGDHGPWTMEHGDSLLENKEPRTHGDTENKEGSMTMNRKIIRGRAHLTAVDRHLPFTLRHYAPSSSSSSLWCWLSCAASPRPPRRCNAERKRLYSSLLLEPSAWNLPCWRGRKCPVLGSGTKDTLDLFLRGW